MLSCVVHKTILLLGGLVAARLYHDMAHMTSLSSSLSLQPDQVFPHRIGGNKKKLILSINLDQK